MREADRLYSILTRDFGLVRAIATGVRKETSKLRGALEPVSISNVSLVRGREFWRLTSGELVRRTKQTKPLVLLEKLVAGEASHPELFDAVLENIDRDEVIQVSQILFHLGYLEESDLNLERKELIKAINKGIEASQMA
jgi:recombinational DNA repair protein (RecF pathway)